MYEKAIFAKKLKITDKTKSNKKCSRQKVEKQTTKRRKKSKKRNIKNRKYAGFK